MRASSDPIAVREDDSHTVNSPVVMSSQDDAARQDSLGRLALVVLQLIVAYLLHRLLHPQ